MISHAAAYAMLTIGLVAGIAIGFVGGWVLGGSKKGN